MTDMEENKAMMMEENKNMGMDDEEKKMLVDSKMGEVDEKEDDEEPAATCPEKYEGEQIIWDLNKLKNENEGRATKD